MSIEVHDFDRKDIGATSEVTHLAGMLCVAEGINPDQAYTVGDRAAQYSGELIFSALRRMGILPEEGIDTELFKRNLRSIAELSIHPELVHNASEVRP